MRTKLVIGLLLALSFLLTPVGPNLQAASMKVGIIDTPMVMRESKVFKEYNAILLDDLEAKRGRYSEMQTKVLEMEATSRSN